MSDLLSSPWIPTRQQHTCIPRAPATESRTPSRLIRVLSSFLYASRSWSR